MHLLQNLYEFNPVNRLQSAVRAVMRDSQLADLSAVAVRVGVSQPQLSRILSGKIGLTPKTLGKLVTGISNVPENQFTLLAAHLYDEAERAGFPLALLKIEFAQGRTKDAITFSDLPEPLQQKLRAVADEIKNGDEGLAGAIDWIAGAIDASRVKLEYREPAGFDDLQAAETADAVPSAEVVTLAAATNAALLEELEKRKKAPAIRSR